jgi:hypothetical protein
MSTSADVPRPDLVSNHADFVLQLDRLRRRAAHGSSRARLGLDALTVRSGIARSSVHTYLSGKALPSADRLDRLVLAMGCSRTEVREWAQARDRVADLVLTERSTPAGADLSRLPTSNARARRERLGLLAGHPEIQPVRDDGPDHLGPTVVRAFVCTTVVGTYVYRQPRADADRTGYLLAGNNWIIWQVRGGENPQLGQSVYSDLWLYTQSDVAHDRAGGWGWAPAAAVAGARDYRPLPLVRWWRPGGVKGPLT